jgi:pentatricopeptide repeat protein
MGIRHWIRKRLAEDAEGGDLPPNASIMDAIFGRETATPRAMGEYDAGSYPAELAELLSRRQQVADELLEMDVTSREGRQAAIPRVRELLRVYPHPLAYETLIHAFVDAGRFDEARGVAFAARERRWECMHSPYPEIRAETDRLNEWSPDEIDALRAEREGGSSPPATPAATTAGA